MIQIIKGRFGFWDGYKVVPKTCSDGPFCVAPEREAELVRDGIAVYVGDEPVCEDGIEDTEDPFDEEEKEMSPEKLEEMSLGELEEFAQQFDLKRKSSVKKADFIAEILEILEKEAAFEPENELKIDPLEAVQ